MRVRADFQFRRKPGRREWLRARLRFDSDQALLASIYHTNSSGALSSLCWADGLIELPEDCAGVAPGDTVDYLPFSGLGRGVAVRDFLRCPTYATWCEPGMSLGALTVGDTAIGSRPVTPIKQPWAENEDSGEMVFAPPMS